MASSIIEDMGKSVSLLQDLPNQEKRSRDLQEFRRRLESQLSPKLEVALSTHDDAQQLSLHTVYCNLGIEAQFIEAFSSFYMSTFQECYLFLCPPVAFGRAPRASRPQTPCRPSTARCTRG